MRHVAERSSKPNPGAEIISGKVELGLLFTLDKTNNTQLSKIRELLTEIKISDAFKENTELWADPEIRFDTGLSESRKIFVPIKLSEEETECAGRITANEYLGIVVGMDVSAYEEAMRKIIGKIWNHPKLPSGIRSVEFKPTAYHNYPNG